MKYMRTYATINLDNIYQNVQNMKADTKKGAAFMAVIKADGYGHGAVPIAYLLDGLCSYYGIATVDEAVELRHGGITKPLLILGYTSPSLYDDVVQYDVTQTIYDVKTARLLSETAKKHGKTAKVHVAVDTGMARIGFCYADKKSIDAVKEINSLENIELEGVFSHFARADEKDKTTAQKQTKRFDEFLEKLKRADVTIPIKHLSNSAGILELDTDYDMVRGGIAMYGHYPSKEMDKANTILLPAMEVKTHIIAYKTLPAGIGVSYGHAYTTKGDEVIATLPIGYADGYPRALSCKGRVLVKGQYAPIVGRICMDQTMVNITGIDGVKMETTVTVMGMENSNLISAEEIGNLSESFNYEVVCRVSKRVPRVYIYKNKLYETANELPFYTKKKQSI